MESLIAQTQSRDDKRAEQAEPAVSCCSRHIHLQFPSRQQASPLHNSWDIFGLPRWCLFTGRRFVARGARRDQRLTYQAFGSTLDAGMAEGQSAISGGRVRCGETNHEADVVSLDALHRIAR